MALTWSHFTAYLDGTRPIRQAERDELWSNLGVLLAGCGGRYSLAADPMAEITASRLITDRTVLDDEDGDPASVVGDLAAVLIAIEDVFTAETGLDAFKEVADDEGLSEAQLEELIGASGRVTTLDQYKVWNLYKRVLDFLTCCPTVLPTWQWRSRSASKSKVGAAEFPGFVSSPVPKRYKQADTTGVGWADFDTGAGEPTNPIDGCNFGSGVRAPGDVSVTQTWADDGTTAFVYDNSVSTTDCGGYSTALHLTGSFVLGEAFALIGGFNWNATTLDWVYAGPSSLFSGLEQDYLSATAARFWEETQECGEVSPIGDAPCIDVVLSVEDTTDDLIARTQAAMPGDWPNTTAGSMRSLATNELTYSERQAEGRLPIPSDLVAGRTYRIYYFERFTPEGGGAAVDGDETYVEVSGDDAGGFTDWIAPTFPTTNGTTIFVNTRWECAPFEE